MNLTINSEQRERIYRSYTSGPLSCKDLLYILENHIAPGAVRGRNELVRRLADCHAHRVTKILIRVAYKFAFF
jgi:hypothetical protein